MLVMLTIITLLAPRFSATMCVQEVSNFVIGLRDEIADVSLMPEGGTHATDTYKLDCTVGESKLY